MILNPWELKWKMPDDCLKYKSYYCKHSRRKPMICGAKWDACRTCLIKQINLTDKQLEMRSRKGLENPIHVCDRCGRRIGIVDRIVYLEPEDRQGNALVSMELCYECSLALLNWAGGKDFILPDVSQEEVDYFYDKPAPKYILSNRRWESPETKELRNKVTELEREVKRKEKEVQKERKMRKDRRKNHMKKRPVGRPKKVSYKLPIEEKKRGPLSGKRYERLRERWNVDEFGRPLPEPPIDSE